MRILLLAFLFPNSVFAAPTKPKELRLPLVEIPEADCSDSVEVERPASKAEVVKAIQEKIESLNGTGVEIDVMVDLAVIENPCVTLNSEIPELIFNRLKGELLLNPESLALLQSLADLTGSTEVMLKLSDQKLKPKTKPKHSKPKPETSLMPKQSPPVCRSPNTMPVIDDEMIMYMRRYGRSRSSYGSTFTRTSCRCR